MARRRRAIGRYLEVLTLDHYLEVAVLQRKPGALPGATALVQAKASGAFTDTHQRCWDAARRAYGDTARRTRALIDVLLAHRSLPAAAPLRALDKAIQAGVLDQQAVLIDTRREATGQVAAVIRSARWPAPTGRR